VTSIAVLHLASGREWRGGQRQTWLLAAGLSVHAEISQLVVTARGSELARRLSQASIPLRETSWSMGIDPRAVWTAWQASSNVDLLHAHDAHAAAIAAVVSRLAGRPFVITRRMARPLRRSGIWRRAARVIAISQAVQQSLLESGVDRGRIDLIPPAIEVDRTRRTVPSDWTVALRIPPGFPVAVAVAALTYEKGIDLVLDAAVQLHGDIPALHWVIAGDGPERSRLEARAGALQALPYVHFLGHLADPLPIMAAATVLVVPSREEGFGSVILDALALGTPVVASNVGGVPEALGAGGGWLVPAGRSVALADAVAQIVRDPARRLQMSQEASRAAWRFDLSPMVERVVALYRSVKESVEAQ
jgi:glycosyltransferase involved in cell wall biosynthesis